MYTHVSIARILYTAALTEFKSIKTKETYSRVLELGRIYYSFLSLSEETDLKIYYDMVFHKIE